MVGHALPYFPLVQDHTKHVVDAIAPQCACFTPGSKAVPVCHIGVGLLLSKCVSAYNQQACAVNHPLALLQRDYPPGTALDQLGVPRGVTITMQWRLGGGLLCMGRLRGQYWSANGDWVGNTAGLLTALAEAAEDQGADTDDLRFWMHYNPAAAEAAAASSGGPEAEASDAEDAADLFPPYRGAPGSMDVGVLSGQHLIPMTPEQVPTNFA